MKKIIRSIQIIALVLTASVCASSAYGQAVSPNLYFNIDWQLNLPVADDYANRISGWGMQGEVGYFLTESFSLGAFIAWHTNNKYIDRQTIYINSSSAVTSDQQHSIYQLPFGAAFRFTPDRYGLVQPYIGAKLGANYSEVSSHLNIFKVSEDKWGFYVSPEVGVTIFFSPEKKFGLHLATYYSYATNKSRVLGYSLDGLNNWGVRIGAAF
ncbi:MAG: porin family protein [Tannerellaceae bacterium]|nr:porin family protein [Tannerellaceae bacterium]